MPEVAAEAKVSLPVVLGLAPSPLRMVEGVNEEVSVNAHFSGPQAAALRSSLAHALEASWYPSGERLAVEQVVAWKMAAEVLHLWGALEVEEAKEDEAL